MFKEIGAFCAYLAHEPKLSEKDQKNRRKLVKVIAGTAALAAADLACNFTSNDPAQNPLVPCSIGCVEKTKEVSGTNKIESDIVSTPVPNILPTLQISSPAAAPTEYTQLNLTSSKSSEGINYNALWCLCPTVAGPILGIMFYLRYRTVHQTNPTHQTSETSNSRPYYYPVDNNVHSHTSSRTDHSTNTQNEVLLRLSKVPPPKGADPRIFADNPPGSINLDPHYSGYGRVMSREEYSEKPKSGGSISDYVIKFIKNVVN